MTEATSPGAPPAGDSIRTLPLAIAVVLGVAGGRLVLLGGRIALTGGILLCVAALAAAGVAFGSNAYGAPAERAPDLSSRLGLGWLGGVLAGLLHGALTVAAGWLGIAVFFGAGVDVDLSALEWWNRAALGGLWGLILGAVYPLLPGESWLGRGAAFGLLLAIWQLFYVYPFRLDLGMAGLDAGWGVIPLVLLGTVIAGVVAAWFVAWGGRAGEEPLSAPLVS